VLRRLTRRLRRLTRRLRRAAPPHSPCSLSGLGTDELVTVQSIKLSP